jgi:tetratricopeptide (TPR) repeat protein
MSRAHWAKGNYLLSSEYAFRALKYYENSKYTFHWGECLLSIGRTFIDLKNYEQAETFIGRAYQLSKTTNDERLLAAVMREKSFLLVEQKKYDSAQYCALLGISIYEKNNDTLNTSVQYSRMARIYFEQGKYKESEPYSKKALLLDSLVKNRRGLSVAYFQAAQIAFQLGQIDKTLSLLKKSDWINSELNNLPNRIRVSELLTTIYSTKRQSEAVIAQMRLTNSYKG